MIITNKSIEGALLEASERFGCSVVEIDYEIISHPRNSFLGLFGKDAMIKIINAKELSNGAKNSEQNSADEPNKLEQSSQKESKKRHPKIALSQSALDECASKITALLELVCPVQTSCSQLENGVISVNITCEDSSILLGKDDFKYPSLDILINHFTNICFNTHARLNINNHLEQAKEQLLGELKALDEAINTQPSVNTTLLSPTLLNIAYEYFLANYPQKIINIKENQAGRYICIWGRYDEHYRASCKRKH